MLFHRVLPATRQSFAHPFPIYEMGSNPAKAAIPHLERMAAQDPHPDNVCAAQSVLDRIAATRSELQKAA